MNNDMPSGALGDLRDRYAKCRTYIDAGVVIERARDASEGPFCQSLIMAGTFETWYVAPRRLRFTFRAHRGGPFLAFASSAYTIAVDDDRVVLAKSIGRSDPVIEDLPDFQSAVAAISGISCGASRAVIPMLLRHASDSGDAVSILDKMQRANWRRVDGSNGSEWVARMGEGGLWRLIADPILKVLSSLTHADDSGDTTEIRILSGLFDAPLSASAFQIPDTLRGGDA